MRVWATGILFAMIAAVGCDQVEQWTKGDEEQTPALPVPVENPEPPEGSGQLPSGSLPPEGPRPPLPPSEPPGPRQPEFSEEFLVAVNHWRNVPPSAFPKNVILGRDLEFSQSEGGVVLAKARKPAGTKVTAIAMRGDDLAVSMSPGSRMRGVVKVDDTDFKKVLAYFYEVNKIRRAEWQRRKVAREADRKGRPTARPTGRPAPRPTGRPATKQKKDPGPLFEDVPGPTDVGHGAYCVCRVCRQKRIKKHGGSLYPDP